jgi:hypothetical protein
MMIFLHAGRGKRNAEFARLRSDLTELEPELRSRSSPRMKEDSEGDEGDQVKLSYLEDGMYSLVVLAE